METNTKKIRDFIYVDQGRLYSLYSQLNQGIAQQIFKSFIHGESATNKQNNPAVDDESIESQRSRSLQQTESTILYDYMYEQLEQKLSNAIVDVSEISKDIDINVAGAYKIYLDKLQSAMMIKVVGRVEIEDYERMDAFVGKANDLMEAMAFFHTLSDEATATLNTLEEQLKNEKNRDKRAQINAQIKRLKNPKAHAQDLNLLDDPELIKRLRVILEIFYDKKFEISVNSGTPVFTTFRGIIEKEWLRVRPEILRALYGGIVTSPWTMVGQITSIPYIGVDGLDAFNAGIEERLPQAKSVRDPLKFLFNRLKAIEAIVNQSTLSIEQIVCPLAIYRELEVPSID